MAKRNRAPAPTYGNGNGHGNVQNTELVQRSVTANDHLNRIKANGASSVFYFNVAGGGGYPEAGWLPASTSGLLWWSHYSDRVLRSSVHMESMWANTVGMFISKIASQSWELKGIRIQRFQEMLLNGWTDFISKMARDYLTTDNGCFAQIVRQSSAAGSRVLGVVQLDSVRCTRTGDLDYPLVYQDWVGHLHALRAHEVIMMCDMPSPSNSYFGVGMSAARKVFNSIVTLASIEQLVQEKTSGAEPTGISFVNASIDEDQLQDAVNATKESRVAKGYLRYMGVVIVPLVNLDANPTVATIPLKSLPEGYNAEQERENCHRNYALATGQDPQTINPRLIGSGSRGTSAQSTTLKEQQQGSLPVLFKTDLTHLLNTSVLPPSVSFYFGIRDLSEELKEAQIRKLHAETRQIQIASGEITPIIASQIAVEQDELSPRFINAPEDSQPLSDTDKAGEVNAELAQPVATLSAQDTPALATKEFKARLAVDRALGKDETSLAQIKQWQDVLVRAKEEGDYARLLIQQVQAKAMTE